jgi:hypothetical protein
VIEEGKNVLDRRREGIRGDYCREEVLGPCMLEIADFEAEGGKRKGWFWCRCFLRVFGL